MIRSWPMVCFSEASATDLDRVEGHRGVDPRRSDQRFGYFFKEEDSQRD